MVSAIKNPDKQRAGQIGALTRWGEPRLVRLDELSGPQRQVVVALVDALKQSAPAANAETLLEVDRVSDDHHHQR